MVKHILSIYPVCHNYQETVERLLFGCDLMKAETLTEVAQSPTSLQVCARKHPPRGLFKINCDVAVNKHSTHGAMAVVLRDDRGHSLDGVTRSIVVSSTLKGEVLAIRFACFLSEVHKLQKVEIEHDNRTAILLGVSENVPPWEVAIILQDIRNLASLRKHHLRWSSRSCNRVAHRLAKTVSCGLDPH
ncbi:hypothetical protein ACSBR2_012116 [Camellia fascicularis]